MFAPLADPLRPAKIGSVLLGPAPVKTLASLMATSVQELIVQAQTHDHADIDIFEWRSDYFSDTSISTLHHAAQCLRQHCSKPILWTYRTSFEGGLGTATPENYLDLTLRLLSTDCIDAVDYEVDRGHAQEVAQLAKEQHCTLVMSYHNFDRTPAFSEITDRLLHMDALGADVLKIALMPRCPEDVLTLMQAVVQTRRLTQKPIIAMSMGAAGQISRVAGRLYGSCATFTCLEHASAPGQLDLNSVKKFLETLAI